MRTKNMIWGLLALVFCAMFVTGGASALTIEHSNYTCMPGQTVSIEVTIPNATYNTSADDIYSAGYEYINETTPESLYIDIPFAPPPVFTTWYGLSDDEIEAISDYDGDTFINLSYAGDSAGLDYYLIMDTDLDNYGSMNFKLADPIDYFDGVMIKKSFNLDIFQISVSNTTYGSAYSECMLANDDLDDDLEFPDSVNSSYRFTGGVDDGFGFLTFPEYVEEFGLIDNITLYFDNFYSYDQAEEDLLYEFHLFNREVGIGSVQITNEETIEMAWGTDSTQVTASTWLVDVKVPSTATLGAYLVTITDTTGASDTTTITVQTSTNNIWFWGWALLMFGLATCFGVGAARLENSGKDTLAVAACSIIAVVCLIFGIMISADILGFTHFGFLGAGFSALLTRLKKPKMHIGKRKIVAFGAMLIGAMLICGASVSVIGAYTVSSSKTSMAPGDSFTVTVYDTTGNLNKTVLNSLVTVKKMDDDAPFFVYWTKTITVADDDESATIRFVTPDSVTLGTYNIIIEGIGITTVYIKETTPTNWMVIALFALIGGIVLTFGLALAFTTKTHTDDVAVIIVGAIFEGIAVLCYLGYINL